MPELPPEPPPDPPPPVFPGLFTVTELEDFERDRLTLREVAPDDVVTGPRAADATAGVADRVGPAALTGAVGLDGAAGVPGIVGGVVSCAKAGTGSSIIAPARSRYFIGLVLYLNEELQFLEFAAMRFPIQRITGTAMDLPSAR